MKVSRIKHPKFVDSPVTRRLRDEEEDLMASMPPSSPKDQPSRSMDEEGADRKGPSVPALKMKKMAKGGPVREEAPEDAGNPQSRIDTGWGKIIVASEDKEDKDDMKLAEGGMINGKLSMSRAEEDGAEHPAGLEEDNDQMRPSMNDYMSDHEQMLAKGGMLLDEMQEEHESSIAAAIMAKRRQAHPMQDHDEDMEKMYAEGGMVDLSINADEEPNNEDQMSFQALKKENYSESEGLRQLNQPKDSNEDGDDREDQRSDRHDMVGAIRKKMRSRE